tara:strand:+ start:1672 stop:1965 length:294 start_codon:yes stop_codon:yes gene_type:complete
MAKPQNCLTKGSGPRPHWREASTNRQFVLNVLAIVVGIAGTYGAIGFLFLIDALQLFVYGAASETVYQAAKKLSWRHKLLAPVAGGSAILSRCPIHI